MNDIDELIRKWRAELEALRDERDFILKHNFRVEAMSMDRAIKVFHSAVVDLENCSRGIAIDGEAPGEGEQ